MKKLICMAAGIGLAAAGTAVAEGETGPRFDISGGVFLLDDPNVTGGVVRGGVSFPVGGSLLVGGEV